MLYVVLCCMWCCLVVCCLVVCCLVVYGVVQCSVEVLWCVVQCGVVWCSVLWCVVWCRVVGCRVVWCSVLLWLLWCMVWCSVVWRCVVPSLFDASVFVSVEKSLAPDHFLRSCMYILGNLLPILSFHLHALYNNYKDPFRISLKLLPNSKNFRSPIGMHA